MLYHLFDYLNELYAPPGFDVFQFLTFRSAISAITALMLSFFVGPWVLDQLRKRQIGEAAKVEAPKTHLSKAGTPTMGGLIVLICVVVPALLWSDVTSTYITLTLFATVTLGAVGFIDDYMKVVKKAKGGLHGWYKVLGQVAVGLTVGAVIYYSPEFAPYNTETTLPFFKNLNFDFSYLYIPAVIFIVTATSNAVNLTDGLDGLAIGLTLVVMLALAVLSYVSGNAIYADYLNIGFLPGSGELTVFIAALVGASLGFLWFNFYPAQVFMGDTGSLAIGGIFGVIAVLIKKELLIPILGGVFFMETISVIIQRGYYKYTKRKYGEGRRFFKMAPLHHHFELKGWKEPKIVIRFYIIGILLALLTMTTFKIR